MAGHRVDLYLHPPWPQVHPVAPSRPPRGRVPPPAAPLVPPARPRPALAPHPRSVPRPGLRVHAAADPGRAGRGATTTASSSAIRPSRPWPAPSPRMVRESWAGLGYYRRAANLHRLAQEVVRDHAGVIPADPGGAASGCPASAATRRAPSPASPTSGPRRPSTPMSPGSSAARSTRGSRRRGAERTLWATGAAIMPRRRGAAAWAFNQAIMELGALVCTARVAQVWGMSGPERLACGRVGEGRTGGSAEWSRVESHPERSEGAIAVV